MKQPCASTMTSDASPGLRPGTESGICWTNTGNLIPSLTWWGDAPTFVASSRCIHSLQRFGDTALDRWSASLISFRRLLGHRTLTKTFVDWTCFFSYRPGEFDLVCMVSIGVLVLTFRLQVLPYCCKVCQFLLDDFGSAHQCLNCPVVPACFAVCPTALAGMFNVITRSPQSCHYPFCFCLVCFVRVTVIAITRMGCVTRQRHIWRDHITQWHEWWHMAMSCIHYRIYILHSKRIRCVE